MFSTNHVYCKSIVSSVLSLVTRLEYFLSYSFENFVWQHTKQSRMRIGSAKNEI